MMSIYRVWIIVFASCMLKYKENAGSLINLALYVMDNMKKTANKPDEEMYRKLIEACGHCGLKDRVLSLFKRMKNQGIEPDACTHGVYVTAVAKSQELQKQISNVLSKDTSPNSISLNLDLDECGFIVEDSCPFCDSLLTQEEIMVGWDRSYSSYTTTCPKNFCDRKFGAKFIVIINKTIERSPSLQIEYLSPPLIRKELENIIYTYDENILLSKDLGDKHKILYWNMIMNFKLLKLPNFFLNPNFDQSEILRIVNNYMKSEKNGKTMSQDSNKTTVSTSMIEYPDDNSSLSDNSSHAASQNMGQKLYQLIKRKKSSAGSENMSTRSSVKNVSIMRLFGPYITEFRNENISRSRTISFIEKSQFDCLDEEAPQLPPQMPQFRSYSLRTQ